MLHRQLLRHIPLRSVLLLAAILTGAAITACGLNDDDDTPPITITATPATAEPLPAPTYTVLPVSPSPTADPLIPAAAALAAGATGPLDYPANVNPLTGLPVTEPGALNRRPLAVKISNAPDLVRPQAGIADADLVFEHYVEGGLTRFTAIFWTHTPPRVGSVRSARLIDLELPQMYGALFAYSGANAIIQQRITEQPFAGRAYEGVTTGEPLYFRDPGIEMPHNLFTVPAEAWAQAARIGLPVLVDPPDVRGMVFDQTPPDQQAEPLPTQPATLVTVDYGPDWVEWTYDAATGTYTRVVDGEPHRDANTGAQVSAANVVILYVPHVDDESIIAGEWNGEAYYHTAIQLSGSGTAVINRDGQRIQGVWMRLKDDGVLTFWSDATATRLIPLKPGTTWFQIVPDDFSRAWVE